MPRGMRRWIAAVWIGCLIAHAQAAPEEPAWQLAARLLEQGNPEEALKLARQALLQAEEAEKKRWLALIAEAEWRRAQARRFEDPKSALAAIDLLEEAEGKLDARWWLRRARLLRAAGQWDEALQAALQAAASEQWAVDAAIEQARIEIERGKYAEAAAALLDALMRAPEGSQRADRAEAWLGWIDAREGRTAQAIARLDRVFARNSSVIEQSPELLATYLQLLAKLGHRQKALSLAARFIDLYGTDGPLAWQVRFVRAELWQEDPATRAKARFAYAQLAEDAKGTQLGALASLRARLLALQGERDPKRLRATIRWIGRLAAKHQLSPVEDEAMLALGRLWQRISDPAGDEDRALFFFSKAAAAAEEAIATAARREGRRWMKQRLIALLRNDRARQAALLWRRYSVFRPQPGKDAELLLAMADALRAVGDLAAASRLLEAVRRAHASDLYGERAFVAQARLWLELQVPDGYAHLMRWLGTHETIYRPELLLIAATMRLQSKAYAEARSLLAQIAPELLVPEMQKAYWRAQAQAAEGLKRWAQAAKAWAKAGEYRRAGLAWFEFGDCLRAKRAWQRAGEPTDDEWRYHLAWCEARLGLRDQAEARWQRIAERGGPWAELARLALAISEAERQR